MDSPHNITAKNQTPFSLGNVCNSSSTFMDQPPRIFDPYSSSDDDNDSHHSIDSANRRLDCMIQFLDRKLTCDGNFSPNANKGPFPLPEILSRGGGQGIFRPPDRSAVHPHRPPSLDVRPHPLRETQAGRFLRTLAVKERQIWAGSESGGVRVWDIQDVYKAGGDEDAAPFRESSPNGASALLCMVGDEGGRVIWSGHRDGRVRSWRMDCRIDGFKESFSWQAHRGPVFSIVITSYGDLWSGSEGGVIKIWPWEAIEKAFTLTAEERLMAALIVEKSFVDQRSQIAINGFSAILTSDIKCLLSDNIRAKVWSAGHLSFALWDAHTRDLLKVFSIDGQIENRADLSLVPDFTLEDEVRMKIVSSKKDKAQSSFGFFQRSRNAIMGAADAVRRVAAKGGFGDDGRRTEALTITIDGMIWAGCANGLLVQWDGNGNRVQDFQYHSSPVLCLCTSGTRVWVGYGSGIVQVLDLEGNILGEWIAHSRPVIKMATGAGYLFTLASHGGIRGWNVLSPGPIDSILRSELIGKEFLYTRIENLKILTATWNVGKERASLGSLKSWLGSAASDVEIIVVGLQEVEMGAGFLAMSAAKETVGLEGSAVGQWWLESIDKSLRNTIDKRSNEQSAFERVGSRQLAGLLIAVWVKCNLKPHFGDIDAAAVPCGFGRAIGNKGAVGVRLRIYDKIVCFVNCHFAAHLEAVGRRNADFDHVYRTMAFTRPSNMSNGAAAASSSAISMLRGVNAMGSSSVEGTPELSEADFVIFLGDFNYRLDGISHDEARDFISQRCFEWLRGRDQLLAEMEAGNVFQGMREPVIGFPPTYKFEKNQAGLAAYDSGEKKRIPAWCDRILYRDSQRTLGSVCNLDCPVVASVTEYEACMDVTDSDHKPVRCKFSVEIARIVESVRRQEFGEIMKSNEAIRHVLQQKCRIPETIVSTNNIILQNKDTSILRITNKCWERKALFEIVCEGESTITEDGEASDHLPRASLGFPRWLEVTPAAGIIRPDETVEISVHHEEFHTQEEFVDGAPQNWWCEDDRDKEVVLVVRVCGNYPAEMKNHRIRARHCYAVKKRIGEVDPDETKKIQGNLLHRSDIQRLSNSYDLVNHLRNMRSP